jgi:hypothetical protein
VLRPELPGWAGGSARIDKESIGLRTRFRPMPSTPYLAVAGIPSAEQGGLVGGG